MEKIQKSSNIAANVAKVFRTFSLIGIIFSVIGAACGFLMQGFIAQFYEDPDKLAAAQGSLEADMGVFSFLPFESIKASGNYGVYFGLQLICFAVVLCVYFYMFNVLKKVMENIRDTGRAYTEADAAKTKTNFIVITVLLFVCSGMLEAVIAGILFCGLYNVPAVSGQTAE